MKNKTCVNVGENGKAVTALVANEATAALMVKRVRVPLYRVVLDRTGSLVKEGSAVVPQGSEAAMLFRQFLGDVPEEETRGGPWATCPKEINHAHAVKGKQPAETHM
jgi:hypothetical protein